MHNSEVAKDRARWLELRRSGVTASEIAAVLGIAPESHEVSSAFALFVAKQLGVDATASTVEMRYGSHMEPFVADEFAAVNPQLDLYDGGLYQSTVNPWQLCTFDRLSVDRGGPGYLRLANDMDEVTIPPRTVVPVQIKTAYSRHSQNPDLCWGDPFTDDMPVHIRAQALYEMDIAEAEAVLVPVFFSDTRKTLTYVISRRPAVEDDILCMRDAAVDFMDRLAQDNPPPIDWTPSTASALKTLHKRAEGKTVVLPKRLANRYRRARLLAAQASRLVGQASNEIRDFMGDAHYAVTIEDGAEVKVCTRVQYDREYIDQDYVRQHHPRIAKRATRKAPVDKLHPGGWANPGK
jgi:predicted phage-related endonuclease